MTSRDVSERKQRELERTHEQVQSERDSKEAIRQLFLETSTDGELADGVCRLLVDAYGYEAARVGQKRGRERTDRPSPCESQKPGPTTGSGRERGASEPRSRLGRLRRCGQGIRKGPAPSEAATSLPGIRLRVSPRWFRASKHGRPGSKDDQDGKAERQRVTMSNDPRTTSTPSVGSIEPSTLSDLHSAQRIFRVASINDGVRPAESRWCRYHPHLVAHVLSICR